MARSPSPREEAARARRGEPWLEEAEPEVDPLVGRRMTLVLLLGLLLVMAVAAGVFLVSKKADSPIDVPAEGEVPLIRSPGPWKVPAHGPGTEGVPVEGQGQTVFGAGEGLAPDLPLDPSRLPEEPVPPPASPAPAGPPRELLPELAATPAAPPEAARAEPPPPRAQPAAASPGAPAAGAPVGTVQLGAFSSEARARAAWQELKARIPYLSGFEPLILPIERDGRTLWRLRAAGPDAGGTCVRLKLAGEACEPVG